MKSMKKVQILIIALALIGAGCGKSWLTSLQNNPNAPTTAAATPQLVLPGTITGLVNIVNGTGPNNAYEYPAVWVGYWNYAPGYSFNPTPANYIMTSSSPQLWDPYFGILTNLNFIVQEAAATPAYGNYGAIATILEGLCFKNLVDLYNDIPYSKALKAQKDFYPTYDDASGIYDSIVISLDNAMATLQANNGNANIDVPANDDVLFHGNLTSWIQFANTVKLSMLVQQSNVSSKSAFLSSEASKTAANGFLTGDALIGQIYSSAQPSPIWANFGLSPSGAINTYFTYVKGNQASIDFYNQTNDPRVGYLYSVKDQAPNFPNFYTVWPVVQSNYQADYTGTQNQIPGGVSGLGPGVIVAPNYPAVMMTAAESYFLQAEATLYGWLTGGPGAAQTLYQNGITKSFEFLGVGNDNGGPGADAAALAYYSQNIGWVAFPVGASVDSLDHTIIEQKWAALNGISNAVAYNDWRKTYSSAMNSGWPIVPVSISTSNSNPHMPFRWLYPTEESNNNNAAWTAAGGPSIDPFNNKIFWQP
jgi:Starch-binding associating with outer membrane